jgi:hypothetical protein
MNVDSFWIGERQISFSLDKPVRVPVKPGEVVAFRKGTAALGLRVPWSRGLDGREAQCFLIYDGNAFGAARLAVEHVADGVKPKFDRINAGAALWIRVGSGVKSDEEFANWRKNFAVAAAEVAARPDTIKLTVAGVDGPVSVAARAPWSAPEALEPAPTHFALELNGKDLGGKILSANE